MAFEELSPFPRDTPTPEISVLSATDDHPPDPTNWFRGMAGQSMDPERFEVLLVDGHGVVDYEAALNAVQREFARRPLIHYLRVDTPSRARALNEGLRRCRGRLVLFLGDDFLAPPDFVRRHLEFHAQHPEAEAVGIGTAPLVPEHRTPFTRWLEESGRLFGIPFRSDGSTEVPEQFFYVANASVKRCFLEEAGDFDERFIAPAWDDFEYGRRLARCGMRSYLVPGACVAHFHPITLAERELATRQAGQAARTYVGALADTSPIPPTANWPRWRHFLRLGKARLRLFALPGDPSQIEYWRARLDAAFAAGYQAQV
jgi:glycosyltransferase involved in cell wall biosynthesis